MTHTVLIQKIKASFFHLLASLAVLTISSYFIFIIWYPGRLFDIADGSRIFGIVAVVELIIGPCLTLVVFNKTKPTRELVTDYLVIGFLQITALVYGLYTAYSAKPLFLVFSVDRFELVRVLDLEDENNLPLFGTLFIKHGPKLVEARLPESTEERNEILFSAVDGKDIHLMPKYYVEFSPKDILSAAKPIGLLADSGLINNKTLPASCHNKCVWLPLVAQRRVWTVLIDNQTALPVSFLNIDPFPALD